MPAIARIRHGAGERLAFVEGDTLRLLPEVISSIQSAVDAGAAEIGRLVDEELEEWAFDPTLLLPPLPMIRRDILCAGWNYWEHFEEGRGRREGQEVKRPEHPTFFTKGPNTVIGPFDPIAYDKRISDKWDYEVEVALIIGKPGRSISEREALDHVFGYCLANDVSQRDLQRAHGGQWLKGKSIDRTMPFGPYITLAGDVDPQAFEISCSVNGKVLQDASTTLMAFPIARLIAELSWGMTLDTGNVILTGTPAGVGNARTPQQFLKPGDRVACESPQLGRLENVLVQTDLHSPTRGLRHE